MAVLVLAAHDLGKLSPATGRLTAAATKLGGPVDLLVAGSDIAGVAAEASALPGISRVLAADNPALRALAPEVLTPLLERLAPGYDHIVAASDAVGRDVIPRLAARLDLMPVTDVVAIHGPDRFERPIYAGNAIETVRSGQPRHLLTLRAASFPPGPGATGQGAPVETLAVGDQPAPVSFVAALRTEGERPDLSTAAVVVSGGVALRSAANFALIAQLAQRLGAAIGATRAAVDAGYAPNDWQVGQTGKIIAPDLYIAIGISGALQHLAGMQGAKTIVAINTDPEAPLMQLADFALVGDLFEVVPALIKELERLGVGG